MPKITKPLSNTEISAAKAGDKQYSLTDGDGLYLRIATSGTKTWLFNYYRPHTNKRANLSFGNYPSVTLAEARSMRSDSRSLLAKGIDPQASKVQSARNNQEQLMKNTEQPDRVRGEMMQKNVGSPEYKMEELQEFSNKDYSQWVKLFHSYTRFRNHRENECESGYEEVYCLREGFYIRILNFDILKPSKVRLTFAGKHLLFCFKLKGTHVLRSSSGTEMHQSAATAAIYYFDQDESLEDLCDGGSDYLMVMLVVDPDVITQLPFSYQSHSFPELLKPALSKGSSRLEFSYTFGPDMLSVGNALVDRKVTGEHERIYLECKSTELLCMLFQDLALLEANARLTNFSPQDLEALEQVKEKIDSSLQEIPSISDMAVEYNISQSRLKTGFKSLYGLPVRSYIQGLRMQKAQQLLMEKKLNIDHIAWELGYQHTSSFITAFKQHFGMTPKFYQRHLTSSLS